MISIPDSYFIKERLSYDDFRKYIEIKHKIWVKNYEIENSWEECLEIFYNYLVENHPEILFEWKMKEGEELWTLNQEISLN